MEIAQKPEFVQLIKETMLAYGKPLQEAAILNAWWKELTPFPLHIVMVAIDNYRAEQSDFAPVPNAIAMRCRLMDGRPGPEEAWALALTSRDEEATVVWTWECAEAYAIATPIMALGDEIGARMAFREAYVRMVADARATGRAAVWQVSAGWDKKRRVEAIEQAQKAGLLEAPKVIALLSYEEKPEGLPASQQLEAIKQMLAEVAEKRELQRLETERQLADEAQQWAEKANQSIDEYRASNPHAPLKTAGILVRKEKPLP